MRGANFNERKKKGRGNKLSIWGGGGKKKAKCGLRDQKRLTYTAFTGKKNPRGRERGDGRGGEAKSRTLEKGEGVH